MVPRRVLAAFLALGFIWGSNFIYMKWASESISPQQVTLFRVLFGFVPVVAFATWRQELKREHWRHWYHFLAMSVLATSLYTFAFAAGTDRLPSGIAGGLSGAIPLFAFIAAAALLKSENVTAVRLGGVLVGFSGVLLIARPWESSGGLDLVGVGYMLLGSASVGLSFVYARKYVSRLGIAPIALTTYQMTLALLTLLALTSWSGASAITADPKALIGLVLGLGVLGTGLAYILYYFLIGQLGAITASSATYLPPVVALAIGWALVGEPITWLDLIAVALILTGVVILRLSQR